MSPLATLGFGRGRKTHLPKHTPSPLSQSHSPYPQSPLIKGRVKGKPDHDSGIAIYPDDPRQGSEQQDTGGYPETGDHDTLAKRVKANRQSALGSVPEYPSGDLWDWYPQTEQEHQGFPFKHSPQAIPTRVLPGDQRTESNSTSDTRKSIRNGKEDQYPEENVLVIKQERLNRSADQYPRGSPQVSTYPSSASSHIPLIGEDSLRYPIGLLASHHANAELATFKIMQDRQDQQIERAARGSITPTHLAEGHHPQDSLGSAARTFDLGRQPVAFRALKPSSNRRPDDPNILINSGRRLLPNTKPDDVHFQHQGRGLLATGTQKPVPLSHPSDRGTGMAFLDPGTRDQGNIRDSKGSLYDWSPDWADNATGFDGHRPLQESAQVTETPRFLVPEVFSDASNVLNGLEINGLWRKARERALGKSSTADFPAFEGAAAWPGLFGNRSAAFGRISKYHNDVILDMTALKDIKDASLAEKRAKTELYGEAGEQMAEQLADIQTMTRQISSKRRRHGTSATRAE